MFVLLLIKYQLGKTMKIFLNTTDLKNPTIEITETKKDLIKKVQNSYMIKRMWNADEIANIPNLTKKELKEICEEIDEINNDA